MTTICGICGEAMIERLVAPCLDCGGERSEVDECLRGEHEYCHYQLFGGELLCDFCDADMPSTDPLAWGFPQTLDWDAALEQNSYKYLQGLKPRLELACPSCSNTLRRQDFVVQNARRNNVVLPKKYWPYL